MHALHIPSIWALAGTLVLAGCPASTPVTQDTGASPDAAVDVATDVTDVADDNGLADLAPDIAVDIAVDIAADVAVDTGPEEPKLTLLAGETTRGFVDGTGRGARFEGITCMAISPDGQWLYVSDTFNGIVRRVDTATGEVTTIGGVALSLSTSDGMGDLVRFTEPRGLSITTEGDLLWIADGPSLRTLDLVTGEAITWAGVPGDPGFVDGDAVEARLGFLVHDVAVSADGGTVILADRSNDRIRTWDVATEMLATLAGGGTAGADGTGVTAGFNGPGGISRDDTTLFVADTFSHTLRQLDLSTGEVTTVAGQAGQSGTTDGDLATARFDSPQGVTHTDGALYAAGFDGLLRKFDLTNSTVETVAGVPNQTTPVDGPAGSARLGGTFAPPIAAPTGGRIYYADIAADSVRVVHLDDGSVQTLAGPVQPEAFVDGPIEGARFGWVYGAVATADGQTIYVADPANRAIRVIDLAQGQVTSITASLWQSPAGLALHESAGLLYVSDTDTGQISRVALADSSVSVLNATPLDIPWGLALGDGVLYVAEHGGLRIQAMDVSTGETTVFAGTGTAGSEDGPAATASFEGPLGLAWSQESMTLFVADYSGHKVRAIDVATSEVSTVASEGLNGPSGLALHDGQLYISDTENQVVRAVALGGGQELRTVLGRMGVPAAIGAGPGVPASQATLTLPEALASTPTGLLVGVEYSVMHVPWEALTEAAP